MGWGGVVVGWTQRLLLQGKGAELCLIFTFLCIFRLSGKQPDLLGG